MRGPAAPTSPGAWDARSEALLGAPALTPPGPGAPHGDPDAPPPGIAPARRRTPPAPPTADPFASRGRPDATEPGEAVQADAEPGAAPRAAAEPREAPPVESAPAAGTAPAAPAAGLAWAVAPAAGRGRRAADPVKVLMHRHRELCERAVDPLEIAAGLEAQGYTDRTAARYRHRDVFALAEELYARVPRGGRSETPAPPREPVRLSWVLATLAPGAVAGLTWLGLRLTDGTAGTAVAAAGALGLGGALLLAVRSGPLRAPEGRTVPAAALWTCWLLAYAVGGDGLLAEVLTGGPDGPWPLAPAPLLLALAPAVAPAAWCARLFASRARRRIADSRGLADFAAATRPLLLGTVALHLTVLTALLALTGFSAGALALGALLLLARLLTVHGFPETAASALAAACAAEALALASVLSARVPVPGFDALDAPVRSVTDAWGPGAVPALVCGAAALGLLAHATGVLSRASAHVTP